MLNDTTPNIIKENAKGFAYSTIQDEMFRKREIECIGEITSERVNSIIAQLRYLHDKDDAKEITIYINSPGGQVTSGLALYDIMQALDCPIRTVCIGTAASMAAILFAAGTKREIFTHGRIMIHDPLIGGGVGGSALSIKSISDDLMRTRDTIAEILSKHTHKSAEEILEVTAKDTYFYANEAVEFGLADNIITHLKKAGN